MYSASRSCRSSEFNLRQFGRTHVLKSQATTRTQYSSTCTNNDNNHHTRIPQTKRIKLFARKNLSLWGPRFEKNKNKRTIGSWPAQYLHFSSTLSTSTAVQREATYPHYYGHHLLRNLCAVHERSNNHHGGGLILYRNQRFHVLRSFTLFAEVRYNSGHAQRHQHQSSIVSNKRWKRESLLLFTNYCCVRIVRSNFSFHLFMCL